MAFSANAMNELRNKEELVKLFDKIGYKLPAYAIDSIFAKAAR
jgi:hypothetical protein